MATTTGSGGPRLEIEIGAITQGLKQGLDEARRELRNFANETKNAGSPNFKNALDAEKLSLAQSRTEAQKARTEIAKLTLAKRQNTTIVKGAAGSYREAQQRLTALGRSIREAEGGFRSSDPAIRSQIKEYRNLNGELKNFDKQMGLNYRNVGNYSSALSGALPGLARMATLAGAVGGAFAMLNDARKTVMEFDSGMRNVEKTTGLATVEVRKLGQELVNISKSLQTVSVQKLTEYATIAGQLGVKGTKDITAFTEALAKLETATNISGEEGGTEIARTLTLIDGGVQNVKAFGDEIVNLGNNFAATEKEILSNAETIAQNVGIYRIGRQDVLAFATATKSVGIEAELVGSSFNRTLAGFERMIRGGKTAGTVLETLSGTQAELATRFKNDAAGVYVDIVRALNDVHKSGGNVNDELDNLGIRAVRDRRVIQSLATNGFDVLTSAIDTSRNSIGALDEEFDTASKKLINQTGRIKIAWDNLILSIEDGQGLIGRATVSMAGYFADLLGEINRLVTSDSWKEFFNRLGEFGESGGGQLMTSNDLRKTFKQVQDFTKTRFEQTGDEYYSMIGASEFNKELELARSHQEKMGTASDALQAAIISGRIKTTKAIEFEYKRQEAFATRHLKRLEKIGKQRGFISAEPAATVDEPKTGASTPGAGRPKTKGRQTNISDILGTLRAEDGNYYDKKINKINLEYSKLVAKIQASSGSKADISEALQLAKSKRDLDELRVSVERFTKEVRKIKPMNTAGLTGSLTVPTELPGLESASRRINRPRISNLNDDFTKEFTRTLRRGLADTFNTLFTDIGSMSDKNYEIEKKYADLRANATQSQIAGLNKMETIERRINNGLSSMLEKIGSTFTGIAGNMLSGALATGISSGNFDDLLNMFSGSKKGVGYGALGSLAGSLIQGTVSPTNRAGQALGGALAGAGTGAAIGSVVPIIGTAIGAIGGAIIGGISSLLGSSRRKKEEELMQLQLAEQRKLVALQERQQQLAYQSSITGQMTRHGVVTSVERDAFGDLYTTLTGDQIRVALDRSNSKRG